MVWPAWSGAELLARSEGGSSQQLPELSSDWECTVCSGSLDMTTCMTKHTPLVTTIDDAFPFVCERRVHFLLGAMAGSCGWARCRGDAKSVGGWGVERDWAAGSGFRERDVISSRPLFAARVTCFPVPGLVLAVALLCWHARGCALARAIFNRSV